MAHAPLLRTQTAPNFHQSSRPGTATGLTNALTASRASQVPAILSVPQAPSYIMSQQQQPLQQQSQHHHPQQPQQQQQQQQQQLSQQAGHDALPAAATAPTGGPQATANIINQRADASRSLYQICIALNQRLAQVPGFEEYLQQLDPADPVESLWALLKQGQPLLTIYNATGPAVAITSDDPAFSDAKRRQKAIFKFSTACMQELHITDCFMIRDLDDNDTTGFVKVTHVVNRVLDIIQERGLLLPPREQAALNAGPGTGGKMTQRDYVVREIVDTERKYVQDLENLHDLKLALEQRGDLSGDHRHSIFMNINAILDFQRRFLIRIEATNSMPASQQMWGSCFTTYEDGFNIYHQFIAGHSKAAETAMREFDKIKLVDHPVAADQSTLDGFLLKPMQRLTKYPLFLKDLAKNMDNGEQKEDVLSGAEASNRVLKRANEAVEQRMLDEALENLIGRVDDWKSHRIDQFGKLLLNGHYSVLTGKADAEKEYDIYLFECILLCCKEVPPAKTKEKKDKTKPAGPKPPNKNAKLQLKGRIFMTNVTDIVSMSKPGSHSVQIWWKGDPGIEYFTIRFPLEDTMKSWAIALDHQRIENKPRTSQPVDRENFTWLQAHQESLENPYSRNQEDDEPDDMPPASAPAVPFGAAPHHNYQALPPSGSMVRNSSAANLRQRSMTNESTHSLASVARGPPPRFPIPMPTPLSLQTSVPAASSPGPRNGDSYFSPTIESPPTLTRASSTTSSVFATPTYTFPRAPSGSMTGSSGWTGDDNNNNNNNNNNKDNNSINSSSSNNNNNNRYTAPAMPRAPSRDGMSSGQNGMVNHGRHPAQGTPFPVFPPSHLGAAAAASASGGVGIALPRQRSRSYNSTADVNGPSVLRRNTHAAALNHGAPPPAVPGIPQYVHENLSRSQTSSPRNDIPVRINTQSPGVQSARLHHHKRTGSLGGTMAQFPLQPIHRQLTPNPGDPQHQQSYAPAPPLSMPAATPISRTVSPASHMHHPSSSSSSLAFSSSSTNNNTVPSSPDVPSPSQLKVKVTCDSGAYFTLVASYNITYQSLIDRIDVKLARFTQASLSRGSLKLRYQDEDGDYVTIESDDDIQIAFQEWRDMVRGLSAAEAGEIHLFCFGDGA